MSKTFEDLKELADKTIQQHNESTLKQMGKLDRLFEEFVRCNSPKLIHYNMMLRMHSKTNLKKCLAIFNHCARKLQPDRLTFGLLLNAHIHARHTEGAQAVLTRMLTQTGHSPDRVTFNQLLKLSCLKSERDQTRKKVWFPIEMRDRFAELLIRLFESCSNRRLASSLPTSKITFPEVPGEGDVAVVFDVLGRMTRAGVEPDGTTYTTVISHCTRQGNMSAMIKLLEMMIERTNEGSFRIQHFTVHALFDAADKFSVKLDFIALLESLRQSPVAPTTATYNLIIGYFGRRGILESANQIFAQLEQDPACDIDKSTYFYMIQAKTQYARRKETSIPSALEALEEARAMLDEMEAAGHLPNAEHFNVVIFMHSQWGLNEEVDDILTQMKQRGVPPDAVTFNHILSCCHQHGFVERGVEVYQRMIEADVAPDKDTLKYMLPILESGCSGVSADTVATLLAHVKQRLGHETANKVSESKEQDVTSKQKAK